MTFPRGLPLQRKSERAMAVYETIAENADGFCGWCKNAILKAWKWCPNCGAEIDWEANIPEAPESAGADDKAG